MRASEPFRDSLFWSVPVHNVSVDNEYRLFDWIEANVSDEPLVMFMYDLMILKFKDETDALMFYLCFAGGR